MLAIQIQKEYFLTTQCDDQRLDIMSELLLVTESDTCNGNFWRYLDIIW